MWSGVNKKVTGLVAGVGMAAVGAVTVSAAAYASTKLLVRVALDRQQPRIPYMDKAARKLRGYENCQTLLDAMAAGAERLETTPHRTVQMQSYDGQTLVGHWFTVPSPKRVIVAMHGWRSSWSGDFGMIAPFWLEQQCNVLFAEQRGQGSSGGACMGFGMMERHDCLEWARWVCKHISREIPIYLAGVSMGASTVLMASELELPPNVKGIMADCGFTSAHDIFKHVANNNLHLNYALCGGFAESLCRKKLHMGTKACTTVQALKNAKVPVLFAHGTLDHFVPVEMTYANYQACATPKSLVIVPGADHGMSYLMEKARYEEAILDFWKKYDEG